MILKQVTYKCSAGKTRTLDINDNPANDFDIINNFVAYESEHPEDAFFPECEDCKIGESAMSIGDDLIMHMIKLCTITKV